MFSAFGTKAQKTVVAALCELLRQGNHSQGVVGSAKAILHALPLNAVLIRAEMDRSLFLATADIVHKYVCLSVKVFRMHVSVCILKVHFKQSHVFVYIYHC